MNLGKSILALATLWVTLAAMGGYVLVAETAPEAAMQRLLLDGGFLLGLLVSVSLVMRQQLGRYGEVVEMLRALSTGARDRRLNAANYGTLQEIAGAANDIAASLCENDDPNLGPVKTRRRAPPPPKRALSPTGQNHGLSESIHPELGPVRVMSKERQAEELAASGQASGKKRKRKTRSKEKEPAPRPTSEEPARQDVSKTSVAPESVSEQREEQVTLVPGPAASEAKDASGPVTSTADDTVIEPASPAHLDGDSELGGDSELSSHGNADGKSQNDLHAPSPTSSLTPSSQDDEAQDLRVLFDLFVAKKKERDEDTSDLDFEAFEQTLTEQGQQLVDAHSCRSVRFEIAVEDDSVSLQPHLIR